MSHVGSSGHHVTPILRDVPGLSWNVPCGILRTPCHTNIEGRPRTDLGCSMWDPPDTNQVIPIFRDVPRLSWDVPWGILRTLSDLTLDIPSCPDCPGHPIMSGESWDVSDTCRQHWTSLRRQHGAPATDVSVYLNDASLLFHCSTMNVYNNLLTELQKNLGCHLRAVLHGQY